MEVWIQIIPYIKRDRDKLNVLFTCKELYTLLDITTFTSTYLWNLRYPFMDVNKNIKKFKYIYSRTNSDKDIPSDITYLVLNTYIHFESMPEQITKLKITNDACFIFSDRIHDKTSIIHIKLGQYSKSSQLWRLFNISKNLEKVTLTKEYGIPSSLLPPIKCLNIKLRLKTSASIYYLITSTVDHVIISTPDAESLYIDPASKLTFNCDIVSQHRRPDDPRWQFKYTGKAKVYFTKRFTMDFHKLYLPNATHLSFSKHYTKPIRVLPTVTYLKYRGKVYNGGSEIDQFRI